MIKNILAKKGDYSVRLAVARNSNASTETLEKLAKDKELFIQRSVAINPHTPDNSLREFVSKKMFLKEVAENRNASETTLREILSLQSDPAAKGIKKMLQRSITQEELTKIFKIVLRHPNLPEQFVDDFLQENNFSVHDIHEIKVSRKELPFSLKVKDFLPYIHDNNIALLAYTEDAQKAIILVWFDSDQIENKTYIQSIKTSQGERYEVMLSISKEAYGIQWYFAKDAVKLSGIVMHEEGMPICCLRSKEVKNHEGEWLCCDYTLRGVQHHEVALYLSEDTITMIRKNHFDVVSFYDKTSGHLMHEAEYRYRYKDGIDIGEK